MFCWGSKGQYEKNQKSKRKSNEHYLYFCFHLFNSCNSRKPTRRRVRNLRMGLYWSISDQKHLQGVGLSTHKQGEQTKSMHSKEAFDWRHLLDPHTEARARLMGLRIPLFIPFIAGGNPPAGARTKNLRTGHTYLRILQPPKWLVRYYLALSDIRTDTLRHLRLKTIAWPSKIRNAHIKKSLAVRE